MHAQQKLSVLVVLLFLVLQLGVLGQETKTTFSRSETRSSSFASTSSSSSSSTTSVFSTSSSPDVPAETETVPSPTVKAEPSPSVTRTPSPSPSQPPPPPSPSPSHSPSPSPSYSPSPSPSHPPPPPSPAPSPSMPRNVTRAVRNAVTSANVEEVATLLIDSDDVTKLGLGFTFSEEERDRVLFETPERISDPDVVSLKGMASAALQANISHKLTEVFIVAIYGTDFDSNLCSDDLDSYYFKTVTKTRTKTTSGYTRTTNSSGTYTVYEEPEEHKKSWTVTYTDSDDLDVDIEVEAMESQEAEDGEDRAPVCYTQEEMQIIRKNLREDFSDLELMASIVDGNPGKSVYHQGRGLKVVGTPVNSWICAACWRKRFCNKHVHWCPQ